MSFWRKLFGPKTANLARQVREGGMDEREKAVKTLAEMKSEEAARALLEALDGTIGERWTGRTYVLPGMLAGVGTAGISAMSEFLGAPETEPDLQCAIAAALGLIGNPTPDAVRALTQALDRESEESGWTRAESAEALGKLGPAASPAIPALARALVVPGSPRIRDAAEEALKQMGPEVIPHARALLSDPEREAAAIHILEHLHVCDPSLFEPLLEVWRRSYEKDPILLRYLAQIAPDRAQGVLEEALQSDQRTKVGDEWLYLDAVAAQSVKELQASAPEVAAALTPAAIGAASRLVDGLEKAIPEAAAQGGGAAVIGERILRLAYYGAFARSFAGRLAALAEGTESPKVKIWLSGSLACIEEDPRPRIRHLCAVMRAADGGGGSGLAGALSYISNWAAGSPAMAAQDSLDRIAAIMGRQIAPVLRELRSEYPDRIDKCLQSIEQTAQ